MSRWVSAHLFFQGNLDHLLANLIAPLLKDLARDEHEPDFFFIRHWEGGPHVRLRIRALDAIRHALIRGEVQRRSTSYFDAWPSGTHVHPEVYRDWASWLGRWEGGGVSHTLYPNNSVQFIPYTRPSYGDERRGQMIEDHFAESSRISLAAVANAVPARDRNLFAFVGIIVAHSAAEETVMPTLIQSARWREVMQLSQPKEYGLERTYLRQRGRLSQLALRAMRPNGSPSHFPMAPELETWRRSVCRLSERLEESVVPRRAETHGLSKTYLLDHCAHLLCNRLGLSLAREAQVRYLLARTLQDLDGAKPSNRSQDGE
jgi:thiopeptide-type bacteriocin biosynthesis protein